MSKRNLEKDDEEEEEEECNRIGILEQIYNIIFKSFISDFINEEEGKMDHVVEEKGKMDHVVEEKGKMDHVVVVKGDEEEERDEEFKEVEKYVFITAGCHGSMKKILLRKGTKRRIVDDSVHLHLNEGSTFTKKTIADPGEGAMVLLCSLRNIAPVKNKAESPRELPRTHADVEAYIKSLETQEDLSELQEITEKKLSPVDGTQSNYDIKKLSVAIIKDFIKKGKDFEETYPTQPQILEINARTNFVFDQIEGKINSENTEDRIKKSHTVKIHEGLTDYWTSYYSSSSYGGLVISFLLGGKMKSYNIFLWSDIDTLQDDLKSQLSDDKDERLKKRLDNAFKKINDLLTDGISEQTGEENYDEKTDKFHWVSTLELFKIIECIQRALPSKTFFIMTDLACKPMQEVTPGTAKDRVKITEIKIGYGGFRKNKSKKNKSKKNKSKKNKSKKNK